MARVLMIDARHSPPTHALTLTTRDPDTPGPVYMAGSKAVWKRLRRHGWPIEYFGSIEWTTGAGARSGGHRRMHGHYLNKGFGEAADVLEVERLVRETWREATTNAGYGAWVVEVAELVVPGAAIHYLNLHHRKPAQAPPDGWRGMIERASRGYWSQPIGELRELARLELKAEALAWATGLDADDARWLAEQDADARRARREEARRLRDELRAALATTNTPAAVETATAIEALALW